MSDKSPRQSKVLRSLGDIQCLKGDRPCPDVEVIRLRCMLANGEICQETFNWLMGLGEDNIDDFRHMTPKQRRRWFAIRASEKRMNSVLECKSFKRKRA